MSNIDKLREAFKKNPLTPQLGLDNLRSEFESLSMSFKPLSEVVFENVDVDGINAEWCDVPEGFMYKVILYVHGGGFIAGSKDMYKDLTARLSKVANCRVLSINYRLAPENIFPSAIEDVVTAYKWLLKKDYYPANIILAGDGAGANLILSALLTLRSYGIRMPSSAICISPWTDLSLTCKSITTNLKTDPFLSYDLLKFCADQYVGEEGDRCFQLVSPFFADLSGLPQMLIMVAENELLFDDALRFSRKAEFFGVNSTFTVAKNMIHNWVFFAPIIVESQQALNYIGNFITNLN